MKRILLIFFILSIVFLTLIIQPKGVQAFPPLPSSFYGTVKINNTKVADGTSIEAVVNGIVFALSYTQMYRTDSVYTISIPGDDPSTTTVDGAREGDVISFKVGGIEAQQTGIWHSGTNDKLDLSATASTTPNTPAPTPTTYPSQTAIPTVKPTVTAKSPTHTATKTATFTSTVVVALLTPSLTTTQATAAGANTATPAADPQGTALTPMNTTLGTGSGTALAPTLSIKDPIVQDQTAGSGESVATERNPGRNRTFREFLFIPLALVIITALVVFVWLLRKTLKDDSDE